MMLDTTRLTLGGAVDHRLREVQRAWLEYEKLLSDPSVLHVGYAPLVEARNRLDESIADLFTLKSSVAQICAEYGSPKTNRS